MKLALVSLALLGVALTGCSSQEHSEPGKPMTSATKLEIAHKYMDRNIAAGVDDASTQIPDKIEPNPDLVKSIG